MTIEQKSKNTYRVRVTRCKVTYSVYFDHKPTQSEAIRAIAKEMEKSDVYKFTFQKALEEYITDRLNVLSPNTVRGYRTIQKTIPEYFNKTKIENIDRALVQRVINELSLVRSPKTMRNIHGLISAVLSIYYPQLTLKTTLPQKKATRDYIPTDEDIRRILAEARGTEFEVAIMLGCCGMRRGEIFALTMDDVKDGHIYINKALAKTYDNEFVVKQPKTLASDRVITPPPAVIDRINKLGYIYRVSPNILYKWLDKTQEKLGIPHFTFHKLRHYYASVSHYLGVPDAYIMKEGGWQTDIVLKTVYRHELENKADEVNQVVRDHLNTLFV